MKRHLLIIPTIIICLVLLARYNNSNTSVSSKMDLKPSSHTSVNNFKGVTMSIKNDTVSPKGLTLVFKNNSDKTCLYGETFWLEEKINEIWRQVPATINGNYAFKSIGYEASSGQNREHEVNWHWLYGSLHKGEYRIVKNVDDFRKAGDYDTYFLAAEFTIS